MPVITTDAYRERANHYWLHARFWLGVIIITQAIYWFIIVPRAVDNREVSTNDAGSLFFADCFFFLSVPVTLLLLARRKARLFERPHNFEIQTLVFQPSRRGEPCPNITITFQWPQEFVPLSEGKSPNIPVLPVDIRARLQADVSATLVRYYEHFVELLNDTHETVEMAIEQTAKDIATQSHLPILKYDCVRIEPPVEKKNDPDPPKGVYMRGDQ